MRLLIITQKVDANDQLLGFFVEWLKRFAQKFERITVICLEKGDFELQENIKVLSLGKEKDLSKLGYVVNFYKYIFSEKDNYDSVFVHMNPIWVILGGPVWKLASKKIFFWYTHKAVTTKLRLAEKFTDIIFTASRESFRLPSKKVIVTGHGIDTGVFTPVNHKSQITDHKLRILSVGRIAPVKNYEALVEAAKILKDQQVDFSVTIIGEAPLEKDKIYGQKLKLLITNYRLQNYFNFLGKVGHKDLPSYYQSHYIFVHLSKTGSLDKTLLEAMASGMRVLSSNDSARAFLPPELIFREDNPAELAEKIEKLLQIQPDPELRARVVQNHNLENLIYKISKIINEK